MGALHQAVIGSLGGAPGLSSAIVAKTVGLFIPSAAGTVFTTSAGSTEATANADRVGRAEALYGAGGDFTQAVDDDRLFLGVDGSDKWLYAGDNSDAIVTTDAAYARNGDVTVMTWVRKNVGNTGQGHIISSATTTSLITNRVYELRVNNTTLQFGQSNQSGANELLSGGTATLTLGNDTMIVLRRTVSGTAYELDTVSAGGAGNHTGTYTVDMSGASSTTTRVGGRIDLAIAIMNRIYAWGVFNAVLSDEEIVEVNAEVERVTGTAFS